MDHNMLVEFIKSLLKEFDNDKSYYVLIISLEYQSL